MTTEAKPLERDHHVEAEQRVTPFELFSDLAFAGPSWLHTGRPAPGATQPAGLIRPERARSLAMLAWGWKTSTRKSIPGTPT